MARATPGALALTMLAACISRVSTPVNPPDAVRNAKALIIANDRADDIEAFDLSKPETLPGEIAVSSGFSLLWYRDRLSDLQIAPGRITAASATVAVRTLPDPGLVEEATIEHGDVLRRTLTELPGPLARVRIRALDLAECAREGRCLRDTMTTTVCRPCPEPSMPLAPIAIQGEPAPPEPPQFIPCPLGWTGVALDGVAICEPGMDGCPAGDFADDLPTDRPIFYVKAGASGGNGSRASPFGTITAALSQAMPRTVIALSKGTFAENVALKDGVALWGACAEDTIVTSSSGATITTAGGASEAHALQVRGTFDAIVADGRGVSLMLASVAIKDASIAVVARNGARVDIVLGLIERSRSGAIFADGLETIATLANVVIRDTTGGEAIKATGGSSVSASRIVIDGSTSLGVFASGATTSLSMHDALIRGAGVAVDLGAKATIARLVANDSPSHALIIASPMTDATIEDIALERALGVGLLIAVGAHAVVRRAMFRDHVRGDAWISGAATSVALEDIAVFAPSMGVSTSTSELGRVLVQGAASASIHRISVDGATAAAIVAADGANLELEDVRAGHTRSTHRVGAIELDGNGLSVLNGAIATLARGHFEQDETYGVFLGNRATLTASDVEVIGSHYSGVYSGYSATLSIERLLVDGAGGAGAISSSMYSILDLRDATITETRPMAVETMCGSDPVCTGSGIVTAGAANLSLARFRLSGNAYVGLMIGTASKPTVSDGVMAMNRVADVDAFDSDFVLAGLLDGVIYESKVTFLIGP